MQSVIERVQRIDYSSTEVEILEALNAVSANQNDSELRKHVLTLLRNERQGNQCELNVYAAGMFAICLGGKYMQAGNVGDYAVHPFLHNLRKAMLACTGIRQQLKENARQYIFYTEFYESIPSLRGRITAIAKAHAGADYGDDLLTVLYSLGGAFGKTETEVGLRDAKSAGGTTCVMTARGIYHAAGAGMIGNREPGVNTPNGPQMELGVPNQRTNSGGAKYLEATLLRDDQYLFGLKGFDDDNGDERNRPRLEPGDIYYVDGDGAFKFLLRKGALAAHVGIVVDTLGNAVDTVDGGSGTGAKIDINRSREVKYVKNLGWKLDKSGRSFTTDNIGEVDAYMATFRAEEAVINWLKQNQRLGKGILTQLDRADREIARYANNPALVKQLQKGRAGLLEGARRLIRELKKGESTVGQDRVLRGWWKPDRYPELRYVGRESLQRWLAA